MRPADPETVRALLFYTLPVLVAWLGLGVAGALAATVVIAAAGVVLRLRAIVVTENSPAVELHTITYSHYVEKARWCLDRTGIEYREVPSIGILGMLLGARTVPLLYLPGSRTSVGDSPKILRFLWGNWSGVLPPERIRFLEPTAEALALEKHFDTELGVNIRLWSYRHLLDHKDLTMMLWGIDEPTIPGWQRTVLPFVFPVLEAMVKRMLGVSDARAAEALDRTHRVFAEVDAMLADGRRYLLGGNEPTFVDITFASLAALGIFPEGYGGNAVTVKSPPTDRMPAEWRNEIETLRSTEAGRFVERLYREERFRR